MSGLLGFEVVTCRRSVLVRFCFLNLRKEVFYMSGCVFSSFELLCMLPEQVFTEDAHVNSNITLFI